MLALVPDDIRDAFEIFCMLGDDECARIIGDYHSRRINKAALIVDRTGILVCSDGNVRRIFPLTVLRTVSPGDIDSELLII